MDSGSSTFAYFDDGVEPFQLIGSNVVYSKSEGKNDSNRKKRKVLRRLVSPHPLMTTHDRRASITTVVEATYDDHDDQESIRVAVYSGPVSSEGEDQQQQLHASFLLDNNINVNINNKTTSISNNNEEPIDICWASFPTGNRDHPLLCILTNPTHLSIWDVYPGYKININTSAKTSPSSDLTESSWDVTLPFECCKICALPTGAGLLLQRHVGPEDEQNAQVHFMLTQQQQQLESEDDGFFLQSPPTSKHAPVGATTPAGDHDNHSIGKAGYDQMWSTNPPTMTNATSTTMEIDEALPVPVPSLFTLQHPLEDIVPVALIFEEQVEQQIGTNKRRDGEQQLHQQTTASTIVPMSDVWETVLWVGCAEWVGTTTAGFSGGEVRRPKQQSLVVTYHLRDKRHAIWLLKDAPPPPPSPPLYERTRKEGKAKRSSMLGNTQFDDWEVFGQDPLTDSIWVVDAANNDNVSASGISVGAAPSGGREEALASALGVRHPSLTPRKSMERPPSRGGGAGAAVTSALNNSSFHQLHPNHVDASTPANLFSPRSEPGTMTLDATYQSAFEASNATGIAVPGVGLGTISTSLHANISMQCIYQEESSSPQGNSIFLLSNSEASGTLLLGLVCPVDGPSIDDEMMMSSDTPNPCQIRFFRLEPSEIKGNIEAEIKLHNDKDSNASGTEKSVDGSTKYLPQANCNWKVCFLPDASMRCRSARPIQSSPIPPCFAIGRNSGMATDLLLLRDDHIRTDEKINLFLFRGQNPITSCVLKNNTTCFELNDSLFDSATVLVEGVGGCDKRFIQMKLSLQPQSSLARHVLSAWDAALLRCTSASEQTQVQQFSDISLALRADVCRLEQYLSQQSSKTICGLPDDFGLMAVEAVLFCLVEWELGLRSPMVPQQSPQQRGKSSWEILFGSDFHHSYALTHRQDLLLGFVSGCAPIHEERHHMALRSLHSIKSLSLGLLQKITGKVSIIPHLFDSLHWLCEELRVTASSFSQDFQTLTSLLLFFLKKVDPANRIMPRFREYYTCNFEHHTIDSSFLSSKDTPTIWKEKVSTFQEPPSLFSWIDSLMNGSHNENYLEKLMNIGGKNIINASCTKILSVIRIFTTLFSKGPGQPDLDVVNMLIKEGFSKPSLMDEGLPPGVALPILEVLYRCRNNLSLAELPGWSSTGLQLVGREDLSKNISRHSSTGGLSLSITNDDPRQDEKDDLFMDVDNDGLVPLEKSSSMLFPEDNRIHEAARLLCSSRPIFLRVHRNVEVSDHDYERLKQKRLLALSKRVLALPVGRGMLSLGSLRLSVAASEPLSIPELVLKGRVPPTNASLQLDDSECPSDMRLWPEFHNGVAAGLRLPPATDCGAGNKMTRTWIIHNRPPMNPNMSQNDGEDSANNVTQQQRLNYTHGGLLLALGLRGHLTALEMSDVYEYLTQGSSTTSVGILLGMAANKRGSCDVSVSKMLCLHIPSLIPQHFNAIDMAGTVQSAAIIGCGLLFQKSSHRMITEFLLNEIGKRPETDASAFDRESYTLSCGLALGMVNLHLGKKVSEDGNNRAAGIADLKVEERLYRYMVGGVDNDESRRRRETNDRFSLPSASPNGDNERCSTIFEGDLINTDITAAGSTLALGLMYMKTGNRTIASALALPDTHFLLEFVRPDFLALRVVSRALILWDAVEPTRKWIDSQIPPVVTAAYEEMRHVAQEAMKGETTSKARYQSVGYDRRAIRQIRAHLIAGACFGMGLRYAGTTDAHAKAVLIECILELQTLREGNDAVSVASRPELPILDSCLSCASLALGMVCAGSGDLDALKLFKILRWRCEDDSRYGHHMAYGMAIGLLFLGGGKCTLGRDPEDIAALVAAFFPRFPSTMTDNQFHLQPLRHLYALAAKQQELSAVDINSGKNVHLPVEIKSRGLVKPMKFSVPCLIRNSDSPYGELRIVSDEYYPVKVRLDGRSNSGGSNVFYVKKRKSKEESSSALISSSPSPMKSASALPGQDRNYMTAYGRTGNMYLGAFDKYVLYPCSSDHTGDFLRRVLQQCICQDAEEALPLYLSLMGSNVTKSRTINNVWDLRLFRTYYQERHRFTAGTAPSSNYDQQLALMDVSWLLAYLLEMVERGIAPKQHCADSSTTAVKFSHAFYGDNEL